MCWFPTRDKSNRIALCLAASSSSMPPATHSCLTTWTKENTTNYIHAKASSSCRLHCPQLSIRIITHHWNGFTVGRISFCSSRLPAWEERRFFQTKRCNVCIKHQRWSSLGFHTWFQRALSDNESSIMSLPFQTLMEEVQKVWLKYSGSCKSAFMMIHEIESVPVLNVETHLTIPTIRLPTFATWYP